MILTRLMIPSEHLKRKKKFVFEYYVKVFDKLFAQQTAKLCHLSGDALTRIFSRSDTVI